MLPHPTLTVNLTPKFWYVGSQDSLPVNIPVHLTEIINILHDHLTLICGLLPNKVTFYFVFSI